MSGKTCRDGLHTVFARAMPSLKLIKGEPKAIQKTPALYTLLDDFEVETADTGELLSVTWHFLHRLVLSYQENEAAEDDLLDDAQLILAEVAADPKLGGLLHHNGHASLTAGDAGFTEIPTGSGIKFRTCDFASEVLEVTENG